MRSDEFIRLVHALREKGWTDTEILNHLLIIEGDKTVEEPKSENDSFSAGNAEG